MTEFDYCYSCDICKGLGQAARSPRLSSWTFLSSARNCGSKFHCAQQLVTAFSRSFLAHYHCSLHNTNAHVFWSLLMSSVLSIFMSIWSTPTHLLHTSLNDIIPISSNFVVASRKPMLPNHKQTLLHIVSNQSKFYCICSLYIMPQANNHVVLQ